MPLGAKTRTAAAITLWWLAIHKEALVLTTAPTSRQVKELLWGEIHALLRKSRVYFPEPSSLELKFNEKRLAFGMTTSVRQKGDEGVRFQGWHGQNLLVIVDEAPGIDPRIYAAIDGLRAGGKVRELRLGNPTVASGPLYDCFTSG